MLKEIFLISLTNITTWFDQNCPVQYWKRDLRIPQNLTKWTILKEIFLILTTIADLTRITKASHSKRQLKVLKRKFEPS